MASSAIRNRTRTRTPDWACGYGAWFHPSLAALIDEGVRDLAPIANRVGEAVRPHLDWGPEGWSTIAAIGIAGSALQTRVQAPSRDVNVQVHLALRANPGDELPALTLGNCLARTILSVAESLVNGGAKLGWARTDGGRRGAPARQRTWTRDQLQQALDPCSPWERTWQEAVLHSESTTLVFASDQAELPCPLALRFHHSIRWDASRRELQPGPLSYTTGHAVFDRESLRVQNALMAARRSEGGALADSPAELLAQLARDAEHDARAGRWAKVARRRLLQLSYRGEQSRLEELFLEPRFAAGLELGALSCRFRALARFPGLEHRVAGWAGEIDERLKRRGSFGAPRHLPWRRALASLADGNRDPERIHAFTGPARQAADAVLASVLVA